MRNKALLTFVSLLFISVGSMSAQERYYFQTDFSKDEFAARRAKVFEGIGANSIAIIQGASGVADFNVFRQANTFYYLSGMETPHAYLILDGRSKRTTLYLPHRDEARERNEGKILSAEDADLIKRLSGVDQVRSDRIFVARSGRDRTSSAARTVCLYSFEPGGDRHRQP